MEEKRGKLLEILNSKLVIIVLVFAMFFLATILAGNVIVKEGSMEIEEDLNVSGQISITGASRISVKLSASQSFPNLGYTAVLWDTEVYDNLGEYDTATGIFTAIKAGYYQVNVLLRSASVVWETGERAMILLYKNDVADVVIDYEECDSTVTKYITLQGSYFVYLDAGDNIRIKVWHDQDGAVNFRTASSDSYFTVHRLS